MRPFFVGAAILAIVGALSFFISPDDLILHRKIFLEFMLPAAYGGFLTASMLEWTNYKGNLKPIATILAVLLLAGLMLLPFSPQTASFLVAAYWLALLLFCAWLFWLDRNTDNFTLLMLLAAFTVCQTAYAMTDSLKLLRAQVHLNMAAVMFVSIRVSILLGAEALKESTLKDPVFIPNVVYKNYRNYIFITSYRSRALVACANSRFYSLCRWLYLACQVTRITSSRTAT